jgi:ubiquinone biosynthesis protein
MPLIRLMVIIITFIRYRLDNLINPDDLSWKKKLLLAILLPWRHFVVNKFSRGVRIRRFMEDLGPVFVKFGQILSTRKDLLPDDISSELAKLQDKVPPFVSADAVQIIVNNLSTGAAKSASTTILEIFSEFEIQPLASASVAQVHAAKLHTGEDVVVKVIRPNIKKIILQDINVMLFCAKIFTFLFPETKKLHLTKVVTDYQQTILDELNLLREAANAAQLKHNFRASPILYIPQIYWEYCTESVLVMERIYGVPVTDITTLQANNVNMQKVAERGVEIFFTQVFRDSFFHADMHPGNIWLDISNPEDPKYLGLDFGIVGSLEPEDKYYLASNLLAFFKRDYRKVAELHIQSGWVPLTTSVSDLETAIRTVCEPIFGKPLSEISFGLLLVRLFQVARRFNMEVQPQLILLEKTLLNIEGLGRQLCPDLNLWDTALPYLEEWIQQKLSLSVLRKQLRQQGANLILSAPVLAQKINASIADFNKIKQYFLEQQQRSKKSNKVSKLQGLLCIAVGGVVWNQVIPISSDFLLIASAMGCIIIGSGLLIRR